MTKVLIETDRLILKPVGLEHCTPAYVSWLNDAATTKYLETGRTKTTIEDLKTFIESIDHSKQVFLAIHDKSTQKHIGNIKLHNLLAEHARVDYGILMGDKLSWGKGYAKEASIGIINHAFNKMNVRRIVLGVLDANESAVHLYRKLGFTQEGTLRKDRLCDGKYHDCFIFGLLKEEWKF